jgi:hypothetical protein
MRFCCTTPLHCQEQRVGRSARGTRAAGAYIVVRLSLFRCVCILFRGYSSASRHGILPFLHRRRATGACGVSQGIDAVRRSYCRTLCSVSYRGPGCRSRHAVDAMPQEKLLSAVRRECLGGPDKCGGIGCRNRWEARLVYCWRSSSPLQLAA